MKALRIFKDLVSFLTIVPLAKDESFLENSARHMFLFPLIGGVIGLLTALYHSACQYFLRKLLAILVVPLFLPKDLLIEAISAGATVAFILVLTGLQHFDGLVDLGNVIGLKKKEERDSIAHAWIVTCKGAFLAVFVEFMSFLGILLLSSSAFNALICSEVLAKLAMVTVAWFGKPSGNGLGSLFAKFNSKRKLNVVAYIISFLIASQLFGILSIPLTFMIFLLGVAMEHVSEKLFGRISGDILGATNEISRAACLILIAIMVNP